MSYAYSDKKMWLWWEIRIPKIRIEWDYAYIETPKFPKPKWLLQIIWDNYTVYKNGWLGEKMKKGDVVIYKDKKATIEDIFDRRDLVRIAWFEDDLLQRAWVSMSELSR